jgi:hypothetical protein
MYCVSRLLKKETEVETISKRHHHSNASPKLATAPGLDPLPIKTGTQTEQLLTMTGATHIPSTAEDLSGRMLVSWHLAPPPPPAPAPPVLLDEKVLL